ncbi:MAG: hypothetical protein CVU91_10915 [Firmicutes bacterium HGW-Firmicutes-16]|nr:MAG: hypothetical protein CVU91_10915 [Firmicutes bacterium HGW-Firmicutes-16]
MSKMFDFALEVDKLSQETGRSIPEIIAKLAEHEDTLATITMTQAIPYPYVCSKFVLSGYDVDAIQPKKIKSDYSENNRVALMGALADRLIKGEISTEEYFHKLEELKEGRSA